MTMGVISAAANSAGDSARGTIMLPVVVNGATLIPGNTPVNLQVVSAADGLTVRLVDIAFNGGSIPAGMSQVALDPQTAAANAIFQQRVAAVAGNPRGAAALQAMMARIAVVSGPQMNLPSGTRLTFTLTAPVSLDGAASAGADRRGAVTK
jgi:hypothetical protein